MPDMRGPPRGGRRPGDLRPGRGQPGRRPEGLAAVRPLPRSEAPAASAWDALLEPGERVLWVGRPRLRRLPGRADGPVAMAGLVLFLLALAWIAWPLRAGLALNHGSGLLLLLIGVPMAAFALALMLGPVLAERARLARLSYVLTNRRAAIVSAGPEPDLALYPLTPRTPLRLVPGRPGSVLFARDVRSRPRPPGGGRPRIEAFDVGFERIDDAEAVFRLMRRLCGGPGA